jgi:hypothetical protein
MKSVTMRVWSVENCGKLRDVIYGHYDLLITLLNDNQIQYYNNATLDYIKGLNIFSMILIAQPQHSRFLNHKIIFVQIKPAFKSSKIR